MTLLTSMLRPSYGPNLEIGTVDGMQGREKEAIVISLVRSNESVSPFSIRHDGRSLMVAVEGSRLFERKEASKW